MRLKTHAATYVPPQPHTVKVRTEWSLTMLTYNLKRVLNLVSFEKLMSILRKTASEDRSAVGVKVPQRA